jgi:hypothetical protein
MRAPVQRFFSIFGLSKATAKATEGEVRFYSDQQRKGQKLVAFDSTKLIHSFIHSFNMVHFSCTNITFKLLNMNLFHNVFMRELML